MKEQPVEDLYEILKILKKKFPNYVEPKEIEGKFNDVVIHEACGKSVPQNRIDPSNPSDIAKVALIEQTQSIKRLFNEEGILTGYALTVRGYEVLNAMELNKNIKVFKKSADESNFVLAILTFILAVVGVLQAVSLLFPPPISTNGMIAINTLNTQGYNITIFSNVNGNFNSSNSIPSNQIVTKIKLNRANQTEKLNGNFTANSNVQPSGNLGNRTFTLFALLGLFTLIGLIMLKNIIIPRISIFSKKEVD